jgi:hypothetical protein
VGQVIQPIISGVASGTENDSVVVLTTFAGGQREALCTATMVAPNLLVTARHCVSNVEGSTACAQDGTPVAGGGITSSRNASSLAIFTGKGGVAPDSTVESNAVAHGKNIVVDASVSNVCNHDIAFVILDHDIDAPVSPIRMGAPAATESVTAVGWGVDDTGNLPKNRESRTLPLVGVGPAPYPNNPAWGYGDSEFMTGEGACAGDSGSPAFASTGAIVGIAARTGNGKPSDGNYATTCVGSDAHVVYTQLGNFQKLVDAAFGAAGHPVWLEGQPDPYAQVPGGGAAGAAASTGALPVKKDSAKTSDLGEGGDEPAAPAAKPKGDALGCSMSSGPVDDSVAYAASLVGVFAMLLGLRRRLRRNADANGDAAEKEELPPPTREPYESML